MRTVREQRSTILLNMLNREGIIRYMKTQTGIPGMEFTENPLWKDVLFMRTVNLSMTETTLERLRWKRLDITAHLRDTTNRRREIYVVLVRRAENVIKEVK